jgi:hypothetical protein
MWRLPRFGEMLRAVEIDAFSDLRPRGNATKEAGS